ncbi:MAG TPA: DUF262 domain-containing protein, partial [Terriglobia bacterium]|nr:DUF262 domain-containing protein [Terriglobia bacterium]
MSIMQQSSKAQDRTLGAWFNQIDQGSVKLPRFQRFEAWDRGRITSFLNTIISNLPVGVTLVLEVAGPEKFVSRYIVSADRTTGTVTQNLLDGQQRLTAFWRAMHDNYEWETFFVYLPQFDRSGETVGEEVEVRCVPRWFNKNDMRMPRWAEEPAKCFERGLIPIALLQPGDLMTKIDSWLDAAIKPLEPTEVEPDALKKFKAYSDLKDKIKGEITALRERVTYFNLPYLSLPSDTRKDVALQVFINMNTNSQPLSLYDIIVAEVESVVGESLHDLQTSLKEHCPSAGHYGDLSDLILSTSALLQDKTPNARGEVEMDKAVMLANWAKLERGFDRMAKFLANNGVYDEARLPTNAVLPVIAACYDLIPETGDFLGKGERLLRQYLWSSFFTDRYENTAASRAYADFKALKALLLKQSYSDDELATVPVLNRKEFAIADVDSLLGAGWPKQVGIGARGILAVTTHLGALDFADNKPASFESDQKREYHHIFPDALLTDAKIDSYLALNCAFITWKTNRIIGRKDPLEYLQDRVEWAGEESVRERMKSHLIDFDLLAKASY